jgi:hypothetical protein
LGKYVGTTNKFDANNEEFAKLVDIDLNQFNVEGEYDPETFKIDLTNQEKALLGELEDINDTMNKEI